MSDTTCVQLYQRPITTASLYPEVSRRGYCVPVPGRGRGEARGGGVQEARRGADASQGEDRGRANLLGVRPGST